MPVRKHHSVDEQFPAGGFWKFTKEVSKMHRQFVQTAMAVGLSILVSPIWSATLYVATDGDNGMPGNFNDCQNPNAPCLSVQWALLFVNGGDTIQLAPGTYTQTFDIPNVNNPVSSLRLVGELDDNGEIAVIIRAHENPGQASERVIGIFDTDMEMEISNMVIANGRALADGSTEEARGGGVMNSGADLKIFNVQFVHNEADRWGGGLFSRGRVELNDVRFDSNKVRGQQGDHGGGGMYFRGFSGLTIQNTLFEGNDTEIGRGGGLSIVSSFGGEQQLRNVWFIGNHAGGLGGGMNATASAARLRNVSFVGNTTESRGGGLSWWSGTPDPVVRPKLINAVFSGNYAEVEGGAAYFRDNALPELLNVSIAGNRAGTTGGGIFSKGSHPVIRNSMVQGNLAEAEDIPAYAHNIFNDPASEPVIEYSALEHCGASGGGWEEACGEDGGNNPQLVQAPESLFVDFVEPGFAPTSLGNLRLKDNSEAIDKGNINFVEGIDTDLDGNPRISGDSVDLGAYEFQFQIDEIFLDRFEQ